MDPIPLTLTMIGIMTIGRLARGAGKESINMRNYIGAIFVGLMMAVIQKGNKVLAQRFSYLIIVALALYWAPAILVASGLINDSKLKGQLKKMAGKTGKKK